MKALSIALVGALLVGGSFGVESAANVVSFSQSDEPVVVEPVVPLVEEPIADEPVVPVEPTDPPVEEPVTEEPVVPDEVVTEEPPVEEPVDGGEGSEEGEEEPPVEEPEVPVVGSVTPTISGSLRAGKTLTVKAGTWSPAGVKLTYQWLRDGKSISKATKTSYKIATGDRGRKLSVKVTGIFEGAENVTVTSKSVTVLKVLTAKKLSIGGTSKWHKFVNVKPKGWTSGTKFTYQWLRNGKAVSGSRATKSSYKIYNADWCQTLTVKVTGKKAGYESRSVVSKALTNAGCSKTSSYHRLYAGQRMDSGQQIASKNWKHALKISKNGTGYLYNHGRARWAAVGGSSGSKMFLTPGGNLVVKKGNTVKWQSKTSGKGVKYAAVTAGGELGLYTKSGKQVWSASKNNAYRWNNWGITNLNQNDGRWAGATVGYYRFGGVACVPTAFAMAANSYGVNANPYQVGLVMNSYGDFNQGVAGAGGRSIKAAAAQYGLAATPLYSKEAIKKALRNNQPVIGLVSGPYSITSPGSTHAVVMNGMYDGEQTTVHNPWGGFSSTYTVSTLWAYQSWDGLDRNAGAVFWAIG